MFAQTNTPKWAFQQLVQTVQSNKNRESETPCRQDLPPCLNTTEQNDSKFIPCLICGKLFKSPSAIVQHSDRHIPDQKFNDILDSFECCFCGMSFESPVALSVHQMAAPVVRSSCRKCRKYFYSDQDYDHHICSKNRVTSSEKLFVDFTGSPKEPPLLTCPLGCPPKRRRFSQTQYLRSHLIHHHGCEPSDIKTFDDLDEIRKITIERSEFLQKCPTCNMSINTLNITMQRHIFFHCFNRGPLQQEWIRQLQRFSEENSFDPNLILRLEMESFWLEIDSTLKVRDGKASDDDESRICVEMNRDRDLKYSLPPNFYDDILTKLPDPFSISLDSWRSKKSDLVFIFRVWCSSIEHLHKIGQLAGQNDFRFDVLSADIYRLVVQNLPALSHEKIDDFQKEELGLKSPPKDNWYRGKKPDEHVLRRLENELGFRISGLDDFNVNSHQNGNGISLKRKKKFKSISDRGPMQKNLFKFIDDDEIDFIRDLKKLDRCSSLEESTDGSRTVTTKRIRKKSWKLRIRDKGSSFKSPTLSPMSSDSEQVNSESFSSDDYEPDQP